MGVAFKDLIIHEETSLEFFNGKTLVMDGNNILYQFLTTIRGRDGNLLMDSKGNVTSHLMGLFTRSTSFMDKGIKLAFVFDGKAPELKNKTIQARIELKLEAEKKFLEAQKIEDEEAMKKYASRSSRLTKEMIGEAKKLLEYLGIPVVQAPCEGEAQAAYMVRKGHGFAVGSQDYDSLLHGAPKLARNLSIAGKRKKGRTIGYDIVKPELIDLAANLNNLGIDRNQLIVLAMMIGTDYNPGGIKGTGPKNALKLVKQHGTEFERLFKEVKWDSFFDFSWKDVYDLIKNLPVEEDYTLEWGVLQKEKLLKLLVDEHNFSMERVESSLERFRKDDSRKKQKSLTDF